MKRHRRRIVCFLLTCIVLIFGSMWKAEADGKEAKQYLDTYVTVVSTVYPPAGGVFKAMLSMLDFTGYFGKSPDPVGEAISKINSRLDVHEQQINKLATNLNQLRAGHYGERNWNRFSDLQESRNSLQAISEALADKPTDKTLKTYLAGQARAEAARFLDPEMWTWSDKSIAKTDQRWTDRNDETRTYRPGEMLEPDFKAMPTLEYYTTALVVYMATIEHASGGNAATIQSKYGADLQRHINWLSRRPNWKDTTEEAQSLPEQIMVRVRGEYGMEKYPDDGYCYYWDLVKDDMRRGLSAGEPMRYAADNPRQLCTVPVPARNRAPDLERAREREYGLDVMANLVTLLTSLRDKGTVSGAKVKGGSGTSSSDPSLPRPSPSSPKVEPGGRHKAVFEENGFSTKGGSVEEQILYGVQQDGQLIWHKHYIDQRGGKIRHTFAPTKKVGDGWNAGYKGAYPGGANAIYTLDDSGHLRWHWHHGSITGKYQWREPSIEVGTGWDQARWIIPMDHGVVYTILNDGTLRWQQHYDYLKGQISGIQGWMASRDVGWGWDPTDTYFSGGNGVIYVIKKDNKLMWYKHKGYLKPPSSPKNSDTDAVKLRWQNSWAEPRQVGTGWGGFTKLFSPGEGHIYGVLANGDLMYYRHLGWADGSYRWDENVKGKIASGWDGYVTAWARPFTSDAGSGNPEVDFIQPK